MRRQYVENFRDGDPVDDVFLVGDKQLRVNRKGAQYIQLTLRDRTGGISARFWNAGDVIFRTFENGGFVHATGKVQLFEGTLQTILTHIDPTEAEKVDLGDFLPRTEQDIGKLTERLRQYLLKLGTPALRALAECYLMDDAFMTGFATAPAGVKLHHAYVGGLLEHTVTMMDLADRIVPFYPGVDRDLLIMGVFLHDAGKTAELTYTRAFGYSDEGQLVGHISMAVEQLGLMAAKVPELLGEPVPRETMVRLKHMIISHHGTLEYGSPRLPMTPEAMLLHEIDSMDTRMHMIQRDIKEDRNNSTAWTPYNTSLQRRFYKGGANGDLFSAGNEAFD